MEKNSTYINRSFKMSSYFTQISHMAKSSTCNTRSYLRPLLLVPDIATQLIWVNYHRAVSKCNIKELKLFFLSKKYTGLLPSRAQLVGQGQQFLPFPRYFLRHTWAVHQALSLQCHQYDGEF